jgi:hypothetical protein
MGPDVGSQNHHSFGTAEGKVGPDGFGTNTIERAGKGRGNSDAGSMDNFVARGKLPAGLKHPFDLQQLRVAAC